MTPSFEKGKVGLFPKSKNCQINFIIWYQSVRFPHDKMARIGTKITTRINFAVDKKKGRLESERENGGQIARGRPGLAAK